MSRPGGLVASCVIVAFHKPEAIAPLLERLDHPDIEVIVVNVEDDLEVARVAGRRAQALSGNPGYGAAVNAGAGRACAPVIVFMNDDAEVDADAVLALAASISSGQADVVLPCLVDAEGHRQTTILPLPSPSRLFVEWLLLPDRPPRLLGRRTAGVQKWRSPVVPEPIDAAAATVVAVEAMWLRRLRLPEEYFLYWEENDWFWRLHVAGARVLYDPGVIVRHIGGRDDVRPAKSRLLARNAVRCVRRTQGRRAAAVAWPVVVLWNLRLVILDSARRLTGSSAAAQRVPARTQGLRAALSAWREL